MGRYRKRFSIQPVREYISVGALQHDADRGAQLQHLRRDLPVQPLLVEHRRQQSDRDHHVGLILRRPQRHREAVDVRAPQAAGDDIAVFTQEAPVTLETGPQQLGVFRSFTFHFRQ